MAKLIQTDQSFTGSIGNLIYYKRKDSDQVFVRRKGVISKERIKNDPKFANLRLNNIEYSGCIQMTQSIRESFTVVRHLGDVHVIPGLCALLKRIQQLDKTSIWGEKQILLSQYRQYLVGVEFRKASTLSSFLQVPLIYQFDREKGQAKVELTDFSCAIALKVPNKQPYFRLIVCLGIITDRGINASTGQSYEPLHKRVIPEACYKVGVWFSTLGTVPKQELMLVMDEEYGTLAKEDSLVLSVGVEFGVLNINGVIEAVKHVGGGISVN